MTRWTEFPLRPQGQPWPGLNTRGGKLDPGQGQLEDGSFGAIINEADILEKRKGFVRGMEERFVGAVCGLFRYTSDCGVEYVVVADSDGVKVRTPFDIPTFLGSDSLPFDDFEGEELDTTRWSPTTNYELFVGALQLSEHAVNSTNEYISDARFMQWFKEAAVSSYFVQIQYAFVVGDVLQVAGIAIKRDDTTYLAANVLQDGTDYKVLLELVQSGVRQTLGEESLGGATIADGFLKLAFNAETRVATVTATPSGGDIVSIARTLSEAQANNLGQNSAIGISREFSEDGQAQILQVSGGTV